ncbi:MAG: helix-hairpin-helix domain-containing protein [Deltaproteobacteria bacterium]|nr:helix-hairpin-helix domain-containing protein [Deltaproteobacteria bacterium]
MNRETETGLTALPGVGPVLARAIIRERSRRGGFSRLEDVVAVKGVGPRLFRKIAPMLQL